MFKIIRNQKYSIRGLKILEGEEILFNHLLMLHLEGEIHHLRMLKIYHCRETNSRIKDNKTNTSSQPTTITHPNINIKSPIKPTISL
jgi:hypothetical protein